MNDIVYAGKQPENGLKYAQIILTAGSGVIFYADSTAEYLAGDIIAAPPLCRFTRTGPDANDIYVNLDKALLPVKEPLIVSDDINGGLSHAIRQSEYYFRSCGARKNAVLTGLGNLIAGYIAAFTGAPAYTPVVASLRNEIDRNLSDSSFSLEDYMRKMPLNYDYVRKLFKKEVGVTPHGYLTSSRMELAKNIILSGISNRYSNYTVSQLAEACGFSEPLYFSRVFKKYYGISPSEFGK